MGGARLLAGARTSRHVPHTPWRSGFRVQNSVRVSIYIYIYIYNIYIYIYVCVYRNMNKYVCIYLYTVRPWADARTSRYVPRTPCG